MLGCSSKNYQSVAYVLGEQLFYTAIQDLEIRFRQVTNERGIGLEEV
jgi:hypothetical protein